MTTGTYEINTHEGTSEGKYLLRTQDKDKTVYLYPVDYEQPEEKIVLIEWNDSKPKTISEEDFPQRFQDCMEYIQDNDYKINVN